MKPQLQEAVDFFNKLILKRLASYDSHCFVAGGAVRDYFSVGKISSDIDLYSRDQVSIDIANNFFRNEASMKFENGNVTKYDWNEIEVDVIKKPFKESITEFLNTFDFTVCAAAVTNTEVIYHGDFFVDLARKELRLINPNELIFPYSTLQRVQKYNQKGFWARKELLQQLAIGIHSLTSDELTSSFDPSSKLGGETGWNLKRALSTGGYYL